MITRGAAALALVVGVLAGGPGLAHAGGGRLAPVRERYEPGEVATLVGYTGGPAVDGVPDEPFYAYLRPAGEGAGFGLLRSDVYVGELLVEETVHGGYLRLRVSVTFEIPGYLAAGDYDVIYCDDPCTGALIGDLVNSPLSIGVDPARRVVREWALDEPEIVNLEPDSVVVGPGFQATAAQLRVPAPPPTAPASVTAEPMAPAPAPAPPASARAGPEEMSWPLPTALVIGAAAATGLVLSRRQRSRSTRAARDVRLASRACSPS